MLLEEICQYFDYSLCCSEKNSKLNLIDLFLDSRQVKNNSVFIAIQGYQSHGNQFIDKAIEQGAKLILTDVIVEENLKEITVLYLPDLAVKLGDFSSWFYHSPSSHIKIVGITGTNGKTSTAFYTAQLLQSLGKKVAIMGTLGNGLLGELEPSLNTTLDVVSLNRTLNQFIAKGIEWCVMEVSSHAIVLQRIAGVNFQTVALTQVTRDHLDFHGSIEAYHAAKRQLFLEYPSNNTVINIDDKQGRLIQKTTKTSHLLSYGIENSAAMLNAFNLKLDDTGINFKVSFKGEEKTLQSSLMGQFNIENILCAMNIILINGFSLSSITTLITQLKPVAGRMEKVQEKPSVIIDYAHTSDALEAVLKSAKFHAKNSSLILVFGCGGDRDQGKRPLMGKVAANYADKIIITNDNPRNESAEEIVEQIMEGMKKNIENVQIILDRKQAIERALQQAGPFDIVMIAGKGHENYQEIMGVRSDFSDHQIILDWQTRQKR